MREYIALVESADQPQVKVKGRNVFINDILVGEVNGGRFRHGGKITPTSGYYLRLKTGEDMYRREFSEQVPWRAGVFSYASDLVTQLGYDATEILQKVSSGLEEEDHPHARGEDEWFSMLYGAYSLNIDEAHRLIASGEITATPYDMPVQRAGEMLLHLKPDEYGAGEETPSGNTFSLTATATNREHFKSIPGERLDAPALMVMWNSLRADPKVNKGSEDKAFPMLVDGNHRLELRYLRGDESMPCQVIQNWDDVAKFTYNRAGKKLADIQRKGR